MNMNVNVKSKDTSAFSNRSTSLLIDGWDTRKERSEVGHAVQPGNESAWSQWRMCSKKRREGRRAYLRAEFLIWLTNGLHYSSDFSSRDNHLCFKTFACNLGKTQNCHTCLNIGTPESGAMALIQKVASTLAFPSTTLHPWKQFKLG